MEQHTIHALLVSPDASLVMTFREVCKQFGIEVRTNAGSNGAPEELNHAKFEGVLVDFDALPNPLGMLKAVRQSPANRNAVTMALATNAEDRQQALANGATLVFGRPIDPCEIRQGIEGAYELMVRECRRYFRCTFRLPALLVQTGSGSDCSCTTMNLSSSGIALESLSPLDPGEEVQVVLFLRGSDVMVRVLGTVVWDDKHGKTGISFKCATPLHKINLDTWLDTQFRLNYAIPRLP